MENNIIANEIEISKKNINEWGELNENSLWIEMQKKSINVPASTLEKILKSDFVAKFNPIIDYFENLPVWDKKTDYITQYADYIKLAPDEDKEQYNYHFKKWCVRSVKCATIDNYFNKNVSKIYLNFSDPWPKIRHSKRRLTSDVFLTKYKKIFKGDYFIEMKTDNQNLFEFSLVSLSQNNYKLDFVSLDLYSDLDKDNIATEYEKKFVAKNIKIYKLKAIQYIDKKKTK